MTIRFALAAAIVLAAAAPAWAGSLDGAFGNTVNVTLENGAVVRYHFNADHTYAMYTPDGAQVSGTWEESGDQVCTTPAGGARSCVAANPGRTVGDTWQQAGADGASVTVSITPGR